MDNIYLKYVGNGSSLPDVPARDLTKEEATQHGERKLLESKLYVLAKQNKIVTPKSENKES